MFNAQDARRMVAEHFARGEEKSQEWFVSNLEAALNKVHTAAGAGKIETEYEVNMSKEKYTLPKKRLLINAITNLGFSVSTRTKTTGNFQEAVVFMISWSE